MSIQSKHAIFDEHEVLHHLMHFLPAQAPLKDFVHHNTLHGFQDKTFNEALHQANSIFGYKTYLTLQEYRQLYQSGKINESILAKVIEQRKGAVNQGEWLSKVISKSFGQDAPYKIGRLRDYWKKEYRISLDTLTQPILFRALCSFLDQGISIWDFPLKNYSFLDAVRALEKDSWYGFFKGKRAKNLLAQQCTLQDLLAILVGDERLYEQYLFDQQFTHQGWSGMVAAIEAQPETLLDSRTISLKEVIIFELLLEIDVLDGRLGSNWPPLSQLVTDKQGDLFEATPIGEKEEVLIIWQEAFEWSYYDTFLAALKQSNGSKKNTDTKSSFQALFCIDDRECSIRRYLELTDTACETFGTPGFFGIEFFYQPENGKFLTKVCPAPVTPKFLVKEVATTQKQKKDVHFSKHSHSFHSGWLISQTIGFWSAVRLFLNVFKPSISPATALSFRHMDKNAKLIIENKNPHHQEHGLQVGFSVEEMAIRVENVLRSIGLVDNFAPIVYVVGHGASSVNNPHYAAYDCGACSGRAGSVNARTFSYMANHSSVRAILVSRGITIPADTQFVGGLHDTTRDEIVFYDEDSLYPENKVAHDINVATFEHALDLNAKERSRRLASIDTSLNEKQIHDKIRRRSVSLFEPRPELNHATNALCVIGRRSLTKGLFLDRRSFLNSFDYRVDPTGKYLLNILNAAAPVCGGINLEYYFSRMDNQKLGAGSKLPHNVMGLFGVANGIDGDLRPGLPSQMIEVHDPVRLLMLVEHFPDIVLKTIQINPATYQWFENEWVNLVVINPETQELWRFNKGQFELYEPLTQSVGTATNVLSLVEQYEDNIPVQLM